MKSIRSLFSGLLVIGGFIGLFSLLHAQETAVPVQASALSLTATDVASFSSLSDTELETLVNALAATPTLSVDMLPLNGRAGTFYSLQNPNWPPLPADTSSSDAWNLSGGAYLLNDVDFNYDAPQKQTLAKGVTMHAMDFSGPPSFSESSGTNTPDDTVMPPVNYGTNLWIAQTLVTNRYLTGIGSNTLADVQYEIQSVTNIAQTDWQSEGFILGSETTNWTPLSVAQGSRTNQLFLRLRSWADDGSGLPIWWQLQYFGTTGVDPYGNPAGDGWSNLQKFQNGWNPNSFYTPAAPQGLTASLNQASNTASITWLPAPGAVTGYTVEKTDANNYPVIVQDSSVSTTTYQDDLSGNLPDSYNGNNYDLTYRVKANYANGSSSAWSATIPLQSATVSAAIIYGPNGNTYLAVSGVPANAATVQLMFIDQNAEDNGDSSFNYTKNIPVSWLTNGLYQLPLAWQPPATDAYGYADYWDFAASVDTNGATSAASVFGGAWQRPFYDGRVQLKQNLIFKLRAAGTDKPFRFYYYGGYADGGDDYFYELCDPPTNHVESSLLHVTDVLTDTNSLNNYDYYAFHGALLDAAYPFTENALFENFVFNAANTSSSSGGITTGVGYQDVVEDYSVVDTDLLLASPPQWSFQDDWTTVVPLLATNDTRWLCSIPVEDYGSVYARYFENGVTNSGRIYALNASAKNVFGLPFLTEKLASASGTGLILQNISAGGS